MTNLKWEIKTTIGRGVLALCTFILGILSIVFGVENDAFGTLFASIFFLFLVLLIALFVTIMFNKQRSWLDKIVSVLSLFIAEIIMAVVIIIQRIRNKEKQVA